MRKILHKCRAGPAETTHSAIFGSGVIFPVGATPIFCLFRLGLAPANETHPYPSITRVF